MRVPETFVVEAPILTLSQQVVQALEGKIQSGVLKPGDCLPAERVLGEQLGVSRTVVRGAVTDLVARGLLQTLPGGGYTVRLPSTGHLSASLTYLLRGSQSEVTYAHIHAVRRVLEVEIAGQAALNATPTDLAELVRLNTRLAVAGAPFQTYCEVDVAFHRTLAIATQNPLFVVLVDAISETLTDVRLRGMRLPGAIESGLTHHRAILEQVQAGSEAGARRAMEAHLMASQEIQQQAADS